MPVSIGCRYLKAFLKTSTYWKVLSKSNHTLKYSKNILKRYSNFNLEKKKKCIRNHFTLNYLTLEGFLGLQRNLYCQKKKKKKERKKCCNLQKTFSRTWQSFDWRKIDSPISDMHWICWGSLLYPRKYFQPFYPNELISKRLKGSQIVYQARLSVICW